MTNYEKINNMSVEEMVKFIQNAEDNACLCCSSTNNECMLDCNKGMAEWLNKEVSE